MPKNPIREFSYFFTNLTETQRREFERVLTDLENQEEITNLVASLNFLRRKPNQSLPIPEVIATPIVRGAVLEWQLLPDQRIAAYEIRVSNDPNFASFTDTSTFGNNAVIQGLDQTTFVKVRGIRSDGTTGPFSDTTTILPQVFSINGRVQEAFYVRLNDSTAQTILGGADSDFEYTPINDQGFSMVWGSVYLFAHPEIAGKGTPEILITLNNRVGSTNTEYWRASASDYFGTYQVGPVAIPHPDSPGQMQIRLDVQDASPVDKFYITEVLYAHLNSLELGSNTE